ncbi:unnamed protein product [Dibothriocephalus latus]|uniref:Dynein regulatory complex protein 10 n=1 Tax=Dibothriocephalus latus TaxID=60516 RepID=A0A3P7L5N9_DIBLA|nr:unnamed protein product [Dibothriocephalus latus]
MGQLNEVSEALDVALGRRQDREKEEMLYRRACMMSQMWDSTPSRESTTLRLSQDSINIKLPLPINMKLNQFLRILSSNDDTANKPVSNVDDLQNYECFSLEPGQRQLLDLLNKIREGVYQQLLFTCQEDIEREERYNSILKHTTELKTEVDWLNKQVEEKQNEALVETQKLDEKIAELKNDIASINTYSAENIKRIQADDQRQRALEEKDSEGMPSAFCVPAC